MLHDLRHALRLFARCRGFALTAVAMLALGIGATTAIFSIADAAVLRPLPYPNPDRLVSFSYVTPRGRSTGAPPRAFLDWREHQDVFDSITGSGGAALVITGGGEPEQLRPSRVTADYFVTYGVQPILDRSFGYESELPGRDRVALLTHQFWERRFARAPDIVGRMLDTDKGSYEIIGVLPKHAEYRRSADILIPLSFKDEDRRHGVNQSGMLSVVGRLKKGVTMDQAAARLNVVDDRFEDRRGVFNKGWRIVLTPLHETVTGSARSWMLLLLGSVGFVLLIACVNVASLFVAHGIDRVREITVRSALGATAWRISRQLLAETFLIAVCGAVCGFILAWWGVELLRSAIPGSIPRSATIAINLRVLAFTAATAVATAIVCGLLPALTLGRTNVAEGLKEGGRSTTAGRGRRRLAQSLACAEVGAALLLVIGAGLFIRSFTRVMNLDPGFETSNLYVMDVDFPPSLPEAARASFAADIVQSVSSVPGVEGAAIGSARPFSVSSTRMPFTVEGDPPGTKRENILFRTVTPEYLQLIRVPLVRGRGLEPRDIPAAPAAAVINESAARSLFPNGDPLGKRLLLRDITPTIVGVIADARELGREREPEPAMYVSLQQYRTNPSSTLTVRLHRRDAAAIAAVKARVLARVPGRPITGVESVDDAARRGAAPRRFNMLLLVIFGIVALGIATTGIYGLMAYTVRRRTHEIGVRLALGARAGDVAALVLKEGAAVIGLGIAGGLGGAWLLARTIQSFLYEIRARDAATFIVAALVIAAVGLAACWLPMRRAARVDPVIALRAE